MNSKQARKLTVRAVVAIAALIVVGSVSAAGNRTANASSQHASLLSSVSFAHVTPPKGFLSLFTGSVGTTAGFEDDDANLAPDSMTDWNSFAPTTWTGSAPNQSMTKTSGNWTLWGASDWTASTSDSGFAGGTKEDDVCPTVSPGKAPNKDDLARVYIAGENLSGHVYLMLAWVRIPQNSTSSDEHVAFEFNQGTTDCASGGLKQRTAGDLLIIYDFTSGGTPTFSISKWITSGTCQVNADSAPCWGTQQTISAAEGAVDSGGSVTDSIAPTSPTTLGDSEFGEAGIDLTAAADNLSGGRNCERFGTAYAVSRSSGSSSTAQMEDLVGPVNINLSNCVTPSISTTPSPTSGNIGTKLNDTAQVTGGNAPTGTVTFSLYGPSDQTCSGTPLYTETASLSSGSAATTGGPSAAAAGTYHWTATYNGDGNNNVSTSACADEAVTIAKSSPGIGTTPTPASGAIGTTLNDTATVSGGSSPSGTVTFKLYGPSDPTCSNSPLYTETANLSGGSAATTGGPAAAAAGTYHWAATYNGDAGNNTASSACTDEAVTIAKNSPTIATTLSATTATAGDTVHDSSALTGATANAGGTVTYTVYSNDTCSAGARDAGTTTVTSGVPADSDGLAFNAAGTFYWQAVYSGDSNNNTATSPCKSEILTVSKKSPTIGTTLSATTGAVGATVHDSSALTGATSDAGGTVTYTVYTNNTCTTGARDAGTKAVTNGVPADSDGLVFNAAGTFYWQAVYSGDANNVGATSPCTDEVLAIGKNSPSIATTLSAETGAIGATVHDSSALTGATSDAGGTVTYTVYTDDTCSAGARNAGTKTVTAGTPADSNGLAFNAAGTFYWQAVYSGDANNNGATSPCKSEILTIGKNTPSISTSLSETTGSIGDSVNDSSALSGATSDAGGTVTYTVYSNDTCTTGARDAGTKTVTGGVPADSNGLVFSAAGTYYWQAVYSGDANNAGATSPCTDEILTIGKNSPTLATILSKSEAAVGDTVNDTAQLSDATSDAGGTVTYTVYSDSQCSADARDAGTKAVTNGVVADSDGLAFNAAGTFYWQAVYTGDSNNNGATSPCQSEILTVDKNQPTISTTLSADEVLIGSTVHDSSTLAGATSDAGGTVTYSVYTNNECSGDGRNAGTKDVTDGKPGDSDPLEFDTAGTFYWQAVYSWRREQPGRAQCVHRGEARRRPSGDRDHEEPEVAGSRLGRHGHLPDHGHEHGHGRSDERHRHRRTRAQLREDDRRPRQGREQVVLLHSRQRDLTVHEHGDRDGSSAGRPGRDCERHR